MLYPRPRIAALLQQTPELTRAIWRALSSITSERLVGHGRTYGGGLHKLEPRELANISADVVLDALPEEASLRSHHRQLPLFTP
jgi:hypothetical protein